MFALRLYRRYARPDFLVFGLLLLAAGSLVAGLSGIIQGLDLDLVIRLSLLGLFMGWLFSQWVKCAWLSLPAGILIGLLLIWLRVGQLLDKVWYFAWQASVYLFQLQSSLTQGFPAVEQLSAAWSGLLASSTAVTIRIGIWFQAFVSGKAAFDPMAVVFFWGYCIWAAVFWSAWAARRHFQALHVLFPVIVLLAGVLGYTNENATTLIYLLIAILILCVVASHLTHEFWWERRQIDFTDEIRMDLATISGPIVIALVAMAILIPSISIQKIVDAVQNWTEQQNPHAETVGRPLGLIVKPKEYPDKNFQNYENPGLPTDHLIGSGPELSERTVMTVRTFELSPMPEVVFHQDVPVHYWRGVTYDWYTGQGWTTTGVTVQNVPAGKALLDLDPAHFAPLHQEIKLVENVGGIGYFTGILISSDQPVEVAWRSHEDMFAANIRPSTYTVESEVLRYTRQDLQKAGTDYPGWIRTRYLRLPVNLPDRVKSLARDITANALTPYDQAKAIEAYLRNYPYTLDLPAPPQGRDIVDYFLFDLKKGYCDYYSTAMVVLARSIGLPARLVTGFASGNYDSLNARYIVTEADAHSWPEIYFPGYGWVEFEPTAALPTFDHQLNLKLETQNGISTDQTGAKGPQGKSGLLSTWLRTVLVGFFGIALFGLIIWSRVRSYQFAHAKPEETARRLYHQLCRSARQIRIPIFPGDTPLELSDRIRIDLDRELHPDDQTGKMNGVSEPLDILTWLYIQAVYSPNHPTRYQAAKGMEEWNRLRVQMIKVWLKQKIFRKRPGSSTEKK